MPPPTGCCLQLSCSVRPQLKTRWCKHKAVSHSPRNEMIQIPSMKIGQFQWAHIGSCGELINIYIYIGQPLCLPYIQFISSLYPTWKDLGISCIFHQRNRTCGHCGHKDISLDPKSAYLKFDMGASKKRCAWEILLSHQGGSQSPSLSVVLKLSDLIAPCASLHGAETVKLQAPKSVPRSLILSSLHDTVE